MQNILQTERLRLRPLDIDDAAFVSRTLNNIEVARMTSSFTHPFPVLAAEFWIMKLRGRSHQGSCYPYAITQVSRPREMIGTINLFKNMADEWEMGYWISPDYWGRGYASEAGDAVLKEADMALGTQNIEAGYFSDNPASGRVLEKLGFQASGQTRSVYSMARLEKALAIRLCRATPKPLSVPVKAA